MRSQRLAEMIAGMHSVERVQAGLGRATAGSLQEFETTSRTLRTIAALTYRNSDDFGYHGFHCQTYAFMFSGQGGERTSAAPNNDPAVAFDVSHGTQMFIENLARSGGASPDAPGYASCLRQFAGEALACQSKQCLHLRGRQRLREDPDQVRQQRKVGL